MQETGRCINLTRQSRRVWANRAALLFCTRKIGWAWQAFVTNALSPFASLILKISIPGRQLPSQSAHNTSLYPRFAAVPRVIRVMR
jgi:hypothetical protein